MFICRLAIVAKRAALFKYCKNKQINYINTLQSLERLHASLTVYVF